MGILGPGYLLMISGVRLMMRSDDNSLALSYVLGRAWIMLILVCVGTSCLSQSSGRKPRSLDLEL